jgi:hypothetical protein
MGTFATQNLIRERETLPNRAMTDADMTWVSKQGRKSLKTYAFAAPRSILAYDPPIPRFPRQVEVQNSNSFLYIIVQ